MDRFQHGTLRGPERGLEMTEDPEASRSASDARVRRMNQALRAWSGAFGELGRQFALHLRMHSSDAAALVQITTAQDRDAPLTQAQLARRIGLTAPATSSLLNRLEDAGHIQRHRGRDDRRVVTLRSTAAMHEQVHAFFDAVGRDVDRIAGTWPDEQLEAFTGMLTALTGVLDRRIEELGAQRT